MDNMRLADPTKTPKPRRLPASAVLLWCAALLALWFGAVTVCQNGGCQEFDADRRVLAVLYSLRQPSLDAFFTAITWLGSIAVLLPAALALAWRFWRKGQWAAALLLPASLGGAWVLAHIGKTLVDRPRPDLFPALINVPADSSFPSAHTVQITAFALAWVLAPGTRRSWAGFIAAAATILLVAVSRLYLQVHYPSDVLVGLIVATGWVLGLRLALAGRT
ncbi:MAG: phosphatase PAP2 family protein [Pseudomonadota bacterium]